MDFGYLAFEGFESELLSEIQFKKIKKVTQLGRLFLLDESHDFIWCQLKLMDLKKVKVKSIQDAAAQLRASQKQWLNYSYHLHRRSQLIQEKLFSKKEKKFNFLEKPTNSKYGFWCLLKEDEVLLSTEVSSVLPLGFVRFNEDKTNPPSRAYLKLWELFTLHIQHPEKNQVVVDMGSCPGGWTWVLQTLGCHVISVDKAPLDQKVLRLPNVEFVKKDAFKLRPSDIKKPSWFFSDIICDPKDLLEMVLLWNQHLPQMNFVCTIKYKGKTDFLTTEKFLNIPNSKIIHLCHNKHEVTWIKIQSDKS